MTRIAIRLGRLLSELDYAQRRCLELRTGVSFTGPREPSRRNQQQISQLESLWHLRPKPREIAQTDTHAFGSPNPTLGKTDRDPRRRAD